uniref:Uncharacterized protein n=1 Tax=Siphoviridae sp. ct2u94 TaxID=2826277 RepID=A0A8S5QWD6_9CAUD|nr:MAG TPA: hypothetical protein [Siphoviridae sp. ct2u94]
MISCRLVVRRRNAHHSATHQTLYHYYADNYLRRR